MKILRNHKGLASLMEILVASLIFIIAVFGVVSSISLLTPHSEDASKRLRAAYLAKDFLDELRGSITVDAWNNALGNLALGSHAPQQVTIDGVTYTVNWTVASAAGGLLRQITIQVTY